MPKITAFEATDGTLFKDEAKYNEYQYGLNLKANIEGSDLAKDVENELDIKPDHLTCLLTTYGQDLTELVVRSRLPARPGRPRVRVTSAAAA